MKQIEQTLNQEEGKMETLIFLEYPLQVTEKEVQIALVSLATNKKIIFQKILANKALPLH